MSLQRVDQLSLDLPEISKQVAEIYERGSPSPAMEVPIRASTPCGLCPVHEIGLCGALQGEEQTGVSVAAVRVAIPDHATLFVQGDPDESYNIVIDGVVRLSRILSDGRRLVQGFAMPGDFLGPSLYDRHTCTAEALGRVNTCRLSSASYARLLGARPYFTRALLSYAIADLTVARDQLLQLARYSAREKVATFLLNMRDRWTRVNGRRQLVELPMTRQDIADFLGVTNETVSRLMSTFAREGLIAIVPGGVRILDASGLEDISLS